MIQFKQTRQARFELRAIVLSTSSKVLQGIYEPSSVLWLHGNYNFDDFSLLKRTYWMTAHFWDENCIYCDDEWRFWGIQSDQIDHKSALYLCLWIQVM